MSVANWPLPQITAQNCDTPYQHANEAMKMAGIIKLFLLPVYPVIWILKVMLWIVGAVLLIFIEVLFGPRPYRWRRRRRRSRYW